MTPAADTPAADVALQAYLLGAVDFAAVQGWQRHQVYETAGQRDRVSLLLCEHSPLITVGRHGSRAHIRFDPDELAWRGWRIRWTARGGGCFLHLPGQHAFYAVVPLDRLGLGVQTYLERLQQVVADVLADFSMTAQTRPNAPGVWLHGRLVAGLGVAVQSWVAHYGGVLNVDPDLEPFRKVACGGAGEPTMTSLARERRGLVRPALVRERFLEHFAARFGLSRVSLFFDHPVLSKKAPTDAVAAAY
jgi:lipoyl(octanoyl) transferase